MSAVVVVVVGLLAGNVVAAVGAEAEVHERKGMHPKEIVGALEWGYIAAVEVLTAFEIVLNALENASETGASHNYSIENNLTFEELVEEKVENIHPDLI